jgi:transcriptional regulator with XRE-family HTH domain
MSKNSPRAAVLLGQRLRKARLAAGLSRAGIARNLGVVENSVGNWEAGTSGIKVIDMLKFASACSVSPASLLEGL